jgi:hypothetical protein
MMETAKRGPVMKLTLDHRHHEPSPQFTALIEKEIQALEPVLRIDEARVSIERQEASPPFRVSARLVTPGPDVQADATDHTLRAALSKLIRRIRDKIAHRSGKQGRRGRSQVSGRIAPAH